MGYPRHFSYLHSKVDAQCGSPDVGCSASHGIAWHGCSGVVQWYRFKARQAARKCGRRKLGTLSASPP